MITSGSFSSLRGQGLTVAQGSCLMKPEPCALSLDYLLSLFHMLVAEESAKEMCTLVPQNIVTQLQDRGSTPKTVNSKVRATYAPRGGRVVGECWSLGRGEMGHLGKLKICHGGRWDLGWVQRMGRAHSRHLLPDGHCYWNVSRAVLSPNQIAHSWG